MMKFEQMLIRLRYFIDWVLVNWG